MTTLPALAKRAALALAAACACGGLPWTVGVSREIGGTLVRAEIRSGR